MRIAVAMSGGVDSSVAAFLCKQNGHDCMGATMRLLSDNEQDVTDARKVTEQIGIPFEVFDMSDEFKRLVIAEFIQAYERGDTPNPCIICNRTVKFGSFVRAAERMGYDVVATGHYARIERQGGRFLLKKGSDVSKDQSYVLYTLTQQQLSKILFPLGEYTKEQIRAIAEENGFVNSKKHDSQDICFVPDGDYAGFICRYTGKNYPDGDFVDLSGRVLGRHKGIIKYTTGQRKGLGLALPAPMYVMEKRMDSNTVVLCDNDRLFTRTLKAADFNWIAFDCPQDAFSASVKIRYGQREQPARIIPTSPDTVTVEFEQPQRAITAGQSAVVYDGDVVIGGGVIV